MKSSVFLIVLTLFAFISCEDGGPDPEPRCGDGIINILGEECDVTYDGTDTCLTLGYYGGAIGCSDECTIDLSGCEAAGRCGDGVVDAGETEESCCEDTGCMTGVCTPDGCVPAWEQDCPVANSCSENQPWQCRDGEPPIYNCAACGCPGDMVCAHEVCYTPQEIASERQQYLPPLDMPLDWYFSLVDTFMDPAALSFAQFADHVNSRLVEEERLVAVLMGESHGSSDEQNAQIAFMSDLLSRGWLVTGLGMEDNGAPLLDATQTGVLGVEVTSIAGDLTNNSYCAAAESNIAGTINHDEGIYFQYMGSGHTSREVARWDMHWGICSLPHTAECVLHQDRLALTLIAFDPDIWMRLTDQVLMWRVGDYYDSRESVTTQLEQIIGRWNSSFAAHALDPFYDATLNGADMNVRFVPSESNADVWFAFFPRPGRLPWLTMGFQSLWLVSEIQDFLWTHQIHPGNCSVSWNFTPGAEELTYNCGVDTFEVTASVDGVTFEVLDYTLSQ